MAGSKASHRNQKNGKRIIGILFVCIAVLLGLTAMALDRDLIPDAVMDIQAGDENVLQGVSVEGIDLSRMTREEAMAATAGVEESVLSKIAVSIDIGGTLHQYTAKEFGVTTDYVSVMAQALSYGRTGTGEENRAAAAQAKELGVNFDVTVSVDREDVSSVLLPLKETLDKAPVNASYTFTPWGHYADGTPYEPDLDAIISACAGNKAPKIPEDLVRIPEGEMPNKLRYEFWKNTKYVEGYLPKDADISRFVYTEGTDGLAVDMESVIDSVVKAIETGDTAAITAPMEPAAPEVTVEELRKQTQLISSWTSSYSKHDSYNRNWNVAKLSCIVSGVVIQPGEEWSINTEAGARSVKAGWKEAAGISNGGYTQQAGGGVCQISSTVYNAAIRSALDITDSTHHSISSDYIPLGLDATISTNGPDLKIKNPYAVPVFMVSYVNPADRNVTVEVYGPVPTDPAYGEVVYDFSFKDGGTYGTPKMIYYYNSAVAPDDKVLAPGEAYEFAKARPGRKVTTYKHTLNLSGEELKVEEFHAYQWNPISGRTYVNGPDPATIIPVTDPSLSPTPAA